MPDPSPHSPTLYPPRFLAPGFKREIALTPPTSLPLSRLYLNLALQMARNYQMILPEHLEWLDESVMWADDEAVFEATTRFLERVNEHCFPVQTDLMADEVEECTWLLSCAPLQPGGLYLWDDWLEYMEPIPFLCYLQHQAWAHTHAPQQLDDEAYSWLPFVEGLDILNLDDSLNQMMATGVLTLPPPLDGLPHLIGMITKTWDNFWLDCSEEELGYGERVGWDDLDVERLIAEWQEAKPILEQVNTLLHWVEENMRPRLATIADLLNQAYAYGKGRGESES